MTTSEPFLGSREGSIDAKAKRRIRGRGTVHNPKNRFERMELVPDDPQDGSVPRTVLLRDVSRGIIAYNDSPDVGFDASVNPYRGCEHGCVYCYARPTHEFLGFSAGLDFESRIVVKEDAARLLRAELSARKWRPQVIAMSGVTDPYQPIEKRLRLTRGCLEVLVEFRNPVAVVTKNHLVTRDVDLLSELANYEAAAAFVSVTTLDPDLARVMEPRASHPALRLRAIRCLRDAGIPVGVMVAPVVPAITDHEIPAIVEAAAAAGAQSASFVVMRLPFAVRELFMRWLEQHFPDRKEKVLNRIRAFRRGELNDPRFSSRMRGEGIFAEQIRVMFDTACRRAGLAPRTWNLSTAAFRKPGGAQLKLF